MSWKDILTYGGVAVTAFGIVLSGWGALVTWRHWDPDNDPVAHVKKAWHWLRACFRSDSETNALAQSASSTIGGSDDVDLYLEKGLTGDPVTDVALLENRLNRMRSELTALEATTRTTDAALRNDVNQAHARLDVLSQELGQTAKNVATDGLGQQVMGAFIALVGLGLTTWGSLLPPR